MEKFAKVKRSNNVIVEIYDEHHNLSNSEQQSFEMRKLDNGEDWKLGDECPPIGEPNEEPYDPRPTGSGKEQPAATEASQEIGRQPYVER